MIFRLRRSDIVASDSDMKAYGFRDILFAIKARNAHAVSGEYHSAKAEYHCKAIELARGE